MVLGIMDWHFLMYKNSLLNDQELRNLHSFFDFILHIWTLGVFCPLVLLLHIDMFLSPYITNFEKSYWCNLLSKTEYLFNICIIDRTHLYCNYYLLLLFLSRFSIFKLHKFSHLFCWAHRFYMERRYMEPCWWWFFIRKSI